MRKYAFFTLLTLSLLTLGLLVGGPVNAADPGPDPNESGVTETADLPEAPEAPEAPEEAPDAEDTGAVDPTDATGSSTTTSPKPTNRPKAANPAANQTAGTPAAPGAPAGRTQGNPSSARRSTGTSGGTDRDQEQATQPGATDVVPVNGAPVVAATDDDGTDPLPFVIAAVIGAGLGAAGVATFGHRRLVAARAAAGPVDDAGHDA